MAQIENLGKVKGLGEIKVCSASFDKQIISLKNAGAKFPYIISARDTAYMRLNDGLKDGTRTCHAPIYAKDSPIILAMVSPLISNLKMAKKAVEANRNNEYFATKDTEIYDKYAKIAETDKNKEPEKRKAIFLPEKEKFTIEKNSEAARTLFQDVRAQYFDEFVSNGINFYPINEEIVNKQKGTTINYLWFWHPDDGSGLVGYGRVLSLVSGAFGVLKETSEAGSRSKLPYSSKEIKALQKIAEGVKTGELAASKLEKVIGFFGRLNK